MATFQKRKNDDGTQCYRVMIRLKGHPPASATFDRLTDAREWATKTERDMKEGRYFGAARRKTLNDLLEKFEAAAKARLKTWPEVERRLGYWRGKFGGELLENITPARIAECRDELLAKPTIRGGGKRSGADVNRTLAALSSAMSHAVKELRWIERNPCEHVSKPKEAGGRVRFLTDEELPVLLKAVRASAHPDLLPAVLLALTTGARKGEIMGLRWSQIDFKRRAITLNHGETKNDAGRALPLAGEVVELLQARAKVRRIDDDRVFPPADGNKTPLNLREPWKAALVAAGIDIRPATRSGRGKQSAPDAVTSDFRWHDLRHTAASYLTMNGVSAIEVARVLGHKTLAMSLRYSHLAPDRVTELGDKLAERMGV
ncbi:MAG: site-specific integrase [Thiobacillaceae bacterium]|jgi:integrase|nr:site-specific integrase [Thiobacillaceae bacterium]